MSHTFPRSTGIGVAAIPDENGVVDVARLAFELTWKARAGKLPDTRSERPTLSHVRVRTGLPRVGLHVLGVLDLRNSATVGPMAARITLTAQSRTDL